MSTLHDELLGEMQGACKLCSYLHTLTATAKAEWEAEIAQPLDIIGHAAIVVALKRRGVSIEEASVRRHRANHVSA